MYYVQACFIRRRFRNFCVMPAGIRNADFFEGIAGHLQLDESGKEADARFSGWFSEWSADEDLSEDDLAGIRFLWMKIERMKEKMLDQNTYFTFDLFEEYLFALLIEEGTIPDGNDDDDSEGDHFSMEMVLMMTCPKKMILTKNLTLKSSGKPSGIIWTGSYPPSGMSLRRKMRS